MNKPHEGDHRSLVNFIENHQPEIEGERDFAYCKEDLVSLRSGRENTWLDAAVEAVLRWYPCQPIKRIFFTEVSIHRNLLSSGVHGGDMSSQQDRGASGRQQTRTFTTSRGSGSTSW